MQARQLVRFKAFIESHATKLATINANAQLQYFYNGAYIVMPMSLDSWVTMDYHIFFTQNFT